MELKLWLEFSTLYFNMDFICESVDIQPKANYDTHATSNVRGHGIQYCPIPFY